MHAPLSSLWKLPSQCIICHAWPAQSICHTCRRAHAAVRLRCAACALLLPAAHRTHTDTANTVTQPEPPRLCVDCIRQPLAGIDACHAAVSYGWPWQQCVDGFKFGAQTGWASLFADLMVQNPRMVQAIRASDCLIPMPLHPLRLAERGFNQSLLLAKALRASAHQQQALQPQQAVLCSNSLLRIRHTRTQSQLPLADRLRNMRKAFAVPAAKADALAGKRIVLVDDVMTSGASVLSAVQALRQTNVAHVQVLVFARTEKG